VFYLVGNWHIEAFQEIEEEEVRLICTRAEVEMYRITDRAACFGFGNFMY